MAQKGYGKTASGAPLTDDLSEPVATTKPPSAVIRKALRQYLDVA